MWIPQNTTTHQDHVIAHVIGATVLGHFTFDEAIYLLLDSGFVWQIYLDGEMGLLPLTVAIQELEGSEQLKQQLKADSECLLTKGIEANEVEQFTPVTADCLLKDVSFFSDGPKRRLLLHGEENDLEVETSLLTRAIHLRKSSN